MTIGNETYESAGKIPVDIGLETMMIWNVGVKELLSMGSNNDSDLIDYSDDEEMVALEKQTQELYNLTQGN